MEKEMVLLVLYFNPGNKKQTYCLYGDEAEADGELVLHTSKGTTECGRFWVEKIEIASFKLLAMT